MTSNKTVLRDGSAMASNTVTRPLWAALDLCERKEKAGIQAVSMHEQAVNFKVRGWRHLLIITGPALPRGPAAVGLDTEDFKRLLLLLKANPYGTFSNEGISFHKHNQAITIDWASAPMCSFSPPPDAAAEDAGLWPALAFYEQELLSLARMSPSSVLLGAGCDDYFASEIHKNFPQLVSSLLGGDMHNLSLSAARLSGLGRGLTPTGDDLIHGALTAYHYYSRTQGLNWPVPEISDAVLRQTTLLGAHMIELGRLGLTPSPVRDFLIAVLGGKSVREVLAALLGMGASSGFDIAAGAVYFLLQVRHKRCNSRRDI